MEKAAAGLEAAQARRRTSRIDKQIKADALRDRNKCRVSLIWGSHEYKSLLAEGFAAASITSKAELKPASLGAVHVVRKHLCEEVAEMVRKVMAVPWSSTEVLASVMDVAERLEEQDAILDNDLGQSIEKLCTSPPFREACRKAGRPEAYDEL